MLKIHPTVESAMHEYRMLQMVDKSPYVVSCRGVYVHQGFAYVVMDEVVGTDLATWLAGSPKDWEVQSMFQQILQALAVMHRAKVIHSALDPWHIRVGPGSRPVVISLRHAVPISVFASPIPGKTKQSAAYVAPEMESGQIVPESNIYSVGIMLYQATHRGALPTMGDVLSRSIGNSVRERELGALLGAMAEPDVDKRISVFEALTHEYFSVSAADKLVEDRQVLESSQKIKLLRKHLSALRAPNKRNFVRLKVKRDEIVDSVVMAFASLSAEEMLKPLKVQFDGEQGVDAGGLTSDMYTEFFGKVFEPTYPLFECPVQADGVGTGQAYLPRESATSEKSLFSLQVLGRVMAKALLDARTILLPFPSSLYKYLLGIPVNLRDLEAYDRTAASNLHKVLTEPDVASWCLSFPGRSGEMVDVTRGNAEEYVQWHVQNLLVDSRKMQLDAIKTGFYFVDKETDLKTFLSVFNGSDLMLALGGRPTIDANTIISALSFYPKSWKSKGQTPRHMKKFLLELSVLGLRHFLRLVCALYTIPYGGFGSRRIMVQKSKRVLGHSCSYSLEVPEVEVYSEFKSKMLMALAHVENSGFGVK